MDESRKAIVVRWPVVPLVPLIDVVQDIWSTIKNQYGDDNIIPDVVRTGNFALYGLVMALDNNIELKINYENGLSRDVIEIFFIHDTLPTE